MKTMAAFLGIAMSLRTTARSALPSSTAAALARSLGREHLQVPLPKPLPQARLKRLDETQLGAARRPYGDVQCLSPLDITNRECRDHGERQRDREQR
jgi:hypothetical protein